MAFPSSPDAHGIAVLLLLLLALILFTRENIRLETSSLGILALLLLGFEVFPYEVEGKPLHASDFFSGFGHEALVAVSALMIVGQGLVRTGALEPIGRGLAGIWSLSPSLSLLLTLVLAATLSAFVNNVPIVVLLLPVLISIAHRTGKPASSILMPMGFATLIGGMGTTIGTSTNLLVVSVAADLGMPPFQMFDFATPALIAGGIALLYLWIVAPHMLPQRSLPMGDMSPRVFSGHLHINKGGSADGKTLSEAIALTGGGLAVSAIYRDDDKVFIPLSNTILRAGDRLGVRDRPEKLKEYESALGASLFRNDDKPVDADNPLSAEGQQIAEIVVTQGSPLDGATLSQIRFAERFQLVILALHRTEGGNDLSGEDVGDRRLRVGDVLLVQGAKERIAELKREGKVLVLDATSDLPHTHRAPLALGIAATVVIVAAFGLVPIAISATCGVLLMLMTRCLNWQDAVQALSAQVILIVATSLALGSAMLKTGGVDYLAQLYLAATSGSSPAFLLSGLMLVMALLTNIVSNNAAAVVGTPIAINIAQELGLPPEPFVLAVLFGANMSYATPLAYKTNLLVMNAGGYRFSDFVRVGIPLTLIVWGSLSFLLPRLYGF